MSDIPTPRLARAIFEYVRESPSSSRRYNPIVDWAKRIGWSAAEAMTAIDWLTNHDFFESYERTGEDWVRVAPGAGVPEGEAKPAPDGKAKPAKVAHVDEDNADDEDSEEGEDSEADEAEDSEGEGDCDAQDDAPESEEAPKAKRAPKAKPTKRAKPAKRAKAPAAEIEAAPTETFLGAVASPLDVLRSLVTLPATDRARVLAQVETVSRLQARVEQLEGELGSARAELEAALRGETPPAHVPPVQEVVRVDVKVETHGEPEAIAAAVERAARKAAPAPVAPSLTGTTQQRVLAVLADGQALAAGEIHERTGVESYQSVTACLSKLAADGVLERPSRGVYRLPAKRGGRRAA